MFWKIVSGKLLLNQCAEILEKTPLILPTSKFSKIWSVLSIIVIICNLFIYPIDIIMGENDLNAYYPS